MSQPQKNSSLKSGDNLSENPENASSQQLQTSVEAGGHDDGRLPPRGRITAVAAGGGRGGGGYPLKAGQNVICKIIEATPNGYNVVLVQHNMEGFIQSNFDFKPGELKIAQFVCIHKKRALLSLLAGKK